jgi:predicted transcriptional regulator
MKIMFAPRHADAIRVCRTLTGLTQRQLGRAVGLHVIKIHRLEAGKYAPTPRELQRIWTTLAVRVAASDVGPKRPESR